MDHKLLEEDFLVPLLANCLCLCSSFQLGTYNCGYILNHGIKCIASIAFEASLGAGKFIMFPCGITKCICLHNSFLVLFVFLVYLDGCQLLLYFVLLMFFLVLIAIICGIVSTYWIYWNGSLRAFSEIVIVLKYWLKKMHCHL